MQAPLRQTLPAAQSTLPVQKLAQRTAAASHMNGAQFIATDGARQAPLPSQVCGGVSSESLHDAAAHTVPAG